MAGMNNNEPLDRFIVSGLVNILKYDARSDIGSLQCVCLFMALSLTLSKH